jgi:hypothetical protein
MKKNHHVVDPLISDTISALVGKLSLCMLLLTSSVLFYSNSNNIVIPLIYRKICSLSLILLTCFISFSATYEFEILMEGFIKNYDSYGSLLYTRKMLLTARMVYLIFSTIFILTCIFIAFLMMYYNYKSRGQKIKSF